MKTAEEYIKGVCELHGIPPFHEKMVFFYDETGNCRKFTLKDGVVNAPAAIDYDFIVGGIAFEENSIPNVDSLFSKLNLQPTQKELKFRHLEGKTHSFIDTIGTKRVTILLDWLLENNAYIHYSTLNNLYYSVVDLVDSLYKLHPEIIPRIEKELKSALYRFVYLFREELFPFFSNYKYPNIDRNKCKEFCMRLADFIQDNNDDSTMEGFYLETFRQMLKTAGRNGELIFLHDNEPDILVQEYYTLYFDRYTFFPDSKHIFDEETEVQDKLAQMKITYKGKILQNYEFVKSTENRFIQISDAVVGLLGRMFCFLDVMDCGDVLLFDEPECQIQKNNIRKIDKLITQSNEKSPFFIKNCGDVYLIQNRSNKIELLTEL